MLPASDNFSAADGNSVMLRADFIADLRNLTVHLDLTLGDKLLCLTA